MSYGLRINNSAGNKRLAEGDFTHKLYQSGTFTMPALGGTINISVPGLQNTDEWFAVIGGQGVPMLGANQLSVLSFMGYSTARTISYAVYRR